MAEQPASSRLPGGMGIPAPGERSRPQPPREGPAPCVCPCGGRLYLERSKWRCSNCGLYPEACCNGARG
jgi:hypothetical protein